MTSDNDDPRPALVVDVDCLGPMLAYLSEYAGTVPMHVFGTDRDFGVVEVWLPKDLLPRAIAYQFAWKRRGELAAKQMQATVTVRRADD